MVWWTVGDVIVGWVCVVWWCGRVCGFCVDGCGGVWCDIMCGGVVWCTVIDVVCDACSVV